MPQIALASKAALDQHIEDRTSHIEYVIDTGTANAKAVALSTVPASYYDGMVFSFKNKTANTGAVTINVNGLGAKSILKPNGTALSSGNLTADSVYTLRYNGANFILQGSAASGNAVPADVLTGKTFTNDIDEQTGTMPDNGAVTLTPGTANKTIAAGYHNGSGYVQGSTNLIAGNIKDGVSIFGVNGSLKPLPSSTTFTGKATAALTVGQKVYALSGSEFAPPTKISNPATVPPGQGQDLSWSPNNRYLAVIHHTTPFITIYDWNSGTPVKIANPAALPVEVVNGVAWSPNNRYLAIVSNATPFLTIYDFNSGTPVKLANPATLPNDSSFAPGWSPDSRYLAISHNGSPYWTIYNMSSGSPVALTNLPTLPANSISRGVSWSPNGQYVVVGINASPYLRVFTWNNGTATVVGGIPAAALPGIAQRTAWSPDSRYLAVTHTGLPRLTIYDWISGAPVKLNDPAILPTGNIGYGNMRWSYDNRYLAMAHATTPFVTIYDWANGTPVKMANPVALPGGNGTGVAWSADNLYLAVSHITATPYMIIYKAGGLGGDRITPLTSVLSASVHPGFQGLGFAPEAAAADATTTVDILFTN